LVGIQIEWGEALMIDELVFEAAKEALDKSIVIAVTWATHGRDQPILGEQVPVGGASELTPTIRVENKSRLRRALA
jgi:hypothetical protein